MRPVSHGSGFGNVWEVFWDGARVVSAGAHACIHVLGVVGEWEGGWMDG